MINIALLIEFDYFFLIKQFDYAVMCVCKTAGECSFTMPAAAATHSSFAA